MPLLLYREMPSGRPLLGLLSGRQLQREGRSGDDDHVRLDLCELDVIFA